jgi:DNA repair protein RecN (Recombination protein N)
MLRHITIRDFAIIERLDIELGPGMTALTGETGAGKSILIDAIGLLLGDRGDSGCVRQGASQAELAALFSWPREHAACTWLIEQALLDPESSILQTLYVRRIISGPGKSRAWINGHLVTIAQLRTLGEWLVDIHGQHAHQQMLQPGIQRDLLDRFVDPHLLAEVQEAFRERQKLRQALNAARQQLAHSQDRRDLLHYQTGELQELHPRSGEFETLSAEQVRLAHAGELLNGLQAAHDLIRQDQGLEAQVRWLASKLREMQRFEARIAPLLELLATASIQIQEVETSVRDLADAVERDPERLAAVESRIATYLRLARKHQVAPPGLAKRLAELQQELQQLDHAESSIVALEQENHQAQQHCARLATRLTEARQATAQRLNEAVTASMQDLGMPGGRFHIHITVDTDADRLSAHGQDHIEFQVSTNPGARLQPLARIASGGELSRIGLALQVLVSREQTVGTLIFDEVDTGISGAVAEGVGAKLRALGHHYQVLCVTHLPQVAAQAHQQLHVSKHHADGHTHTEILPLDTPARIAALAQLLGGATITKRSLAHAREMLEKAQSA